jgi:glycosyltransferase involved in cell wall biosynthesis
MNSIMQNKNIFIISTIKIYEGNSAGAARLMNIAKALAMENVKVYLCSSILSEGIELKKVREISNNVFLVGTENNEINSKMKNFIVRFTNLIKNTFYLKNINGIIKNIEGRKIFYLYPTPETSMDISALLYLKGMKKYKLFCDVNELRVTGLFNFYFSEHYFKKIYEIVRYGFNYSKYRLHEILTGYYDGLVVISTNLEKYYRAYNDHLLRVPILSDTMGTKVFNVPLLKENEKFKIGFSGQISLKKEGFDILYEALEKVKKRYYDIELNLYGPLAQNEDLLLLNWLPDKYRIKDNIKYNGIIDQKYLLSELQKNHLLILPRPLNPQTKYGFSTKLSEYLTSGVPILVTDVSDNALYIKDGSNGFIVPPGDADAMANKIFQIISDYNKIAGEISIRAFETAENELNFQIYGKTLNYFLD